MMRVARFAPPAFPRHNGFKIRQRQRYLYGAFQALNGQQGKDAAGKGKEKKTTRQRTPLKSSAESAVAVARPVRCTAVKKMIKQAPKRGFVTFRSAQ